MNNSINLLSYVLIYLLLFAFSAVCLQAIAKKTKTKDGWMAWIPILNLVLICKIDARPAGWVLLFFIPFVNIYIWVKIWMEITEELGKPVWIGATMFFPVYNLLPLAYLAFSSPGIFTGIDR